MAENSQAVIPDNLILVDGEIGGVPSSSASDAGKVLAVDSNGDPSWVTPSGGTLYTEGNGIEISDQNVVSIDTTVVATKSDISGLQGELTAGTGIDITNNTISVDTTVIATKSEVPTVDTVYDASSTNAQAGTAVASAISTAVSGIEQVPSSSSADSGKVLTVDSNGDPSWVTPSGGTQYSAGNGINISAQNAISVDTTVVATQTDLSGIEQVPDVTSSDDGKVLTASYSGGIGSFAWATPSGGSSNVFVWEAGTTTNQEVYDAIAAGKDIFIHAVESGDNVVYRMYKYFLSSGTYFVYSSTYSEQGGTGNTGCMVQCIAYVAQNSNVANYKSQLNTSVITDKTDTYDSTSKKAMSGIAVASAISGVTLASLNTAGITDIQQVNALPANPVATVLYLIPET